LLFSGRDAPAAAGAVFAFSPGQARQSRLRRRRRPWPCGQTLRSR
jgi:hypothetical protein